MNYIFTKNILMLSTISNINLMRKPVAAAPPLLPPPLLCCRGSGAAAGGIAGMSTDQNFRPFKSHRNNDISVQNYVHLCVLKLRTGIQLLEYIVVHYMFNNLYSFCVPNFEISFGLRTCFRTLCSKIGTKTTNEQFTF